MKEFSLEQKKQFYPVTMKQIKYAESLAEKTNSKLPNTSQLLKYCSQETMSEIIEEMKSGNQITF